MKLAGYMLLGVLLGSVLALPAYLYGYDNIDMYWDSFFPFAIALLLAGMIGSLGLPLAAATWAVMSGKRTHWRLVAAMMPFLLPIWLSQSAMSGYQADEVQLGGLLSTWQISILFMGMWLWLFRLRGIELKVPLPASAEEEQADADQRRDDAPRRPALQFSIASMFSFTAALAVLMSLLSMVELVMGEGTLQGHFLGGIVAHVCCGLLAPAMLWIVFAIRPIWARIILFAGILMLSSVFFFSGTDAGMEGPELLCFCIASNLMGMVFIMVVLVPARLAGYRLVRHTSVVPSDASHLLTKAERA